MIIELVAQEQIDKYNLTLAQDCAHSATHPEETVQHFAQGGSAAVAGEAVNEAKKKMTYTGSSKHTPNSKGDVSKPPHDGQKALDNSIEVPGKDYRLAVENGQIVKFQEQEPGKYHGYIVENVKAEMIDIDKNALYDAGFIKSRSSCKVTKGK